MIKVLVIDDQTIVRQGISTLLSLSGKIEVIGQADNGKDLLVKLETLTPDVLLMDIRMPEMSGPQALEKLNTQKQMIPTILLTTFNDFAAISQGIKAGAKGCLLKDVALDVLIEAIEAVASGKRYFAEEYLPLLQVDTKPVLCEQLSARELEILESISNGLSNKEIAVNLHLSEGTIKNHSSSIFSKLGVRGRTQAIVKAKELSII
ncbi:MAG: response regulator transcription factor [Oleispira sp.]|nr:response regulator transcription factor [Oleispira sp.]